MVVINDKVIGYRIQSIRLQKKMSQADLVSMLDVSVSYVSRIERGKIRLNIERLIEISLLLNISVSDLLDGSFDSNTITSCNSKDSSEKERLLLLINTATPRALQLMLELCESVYKLVT